MGHKEESNGALHQDHFIGHLVTQMTRIERKVDDMQSALLTMARTEERVTRLMESDTKKNDWIMKLQERVNELEKTDVGQKAVSTRIERVVWIIMTAVLTSFVAWLLTH